VLLAHSRRGWQGAVRGLTAAHPAEAGGMVGEDRGLKATGHPIGQAARSLLMAPQGINGKRRALILLALVEALIWIAYLVDLAVASAPRPLPATYGIFIYALPTYALLLIYAVLLTPSALYGNTTSHA